MIKKLKSIAGKFLDSKGMVKNWYAWGFRKVMKPYRTIPCWIKTKSGAQIRLENDFIDDFILRDMFELSKVYFPEHLKLNAGDILLDLGAHHGIYTAELLKRFPGLKSICVEPDAEGCKTIRKMLAKNKLEDKVEIHEYAIGDFNGDGYLVDNDDGSWGKTISKTFVEGSIKVPMKRLEDVIQGRSIALVKCNTEGGEFSIMPQLIKLNLKPQLIILMIHPAEGNAGELLKSLVDYGYSKTLVHDLPLNPCWHLIRNQKSDVGS